MFDENEDKSSRPQALGYYWELMQRRRWWLILPVFIVGTAAWAVSWFVPAYYRSETLILVEQQKVPEQYVVSNVANDIQDRLQSMTQQILSRTRLLRIIDELHLYADQRARLSPDEIVDKMRQDILIDLVQAPGRRDDLTAFKISYSSKNARLSQQVTNQLTSLFIDENLKARQQQSESTTSFLENQLGDARKSLAEQEQRVREFKTRYLGELPGQMQSSVQILSGLQARLQGELEALNQSKQQNLYLESLATQYRSMRDGMQKGTNSKDLPPALDQELARLKTQLADVQSHYTERHPDYRKLKEQITKIEMMKEQLTSDLKASDPADGANKTDPANIDTATKDSDLHPTDLAELREMSPMLELESQLKANKLEMNNRQKQIDALSSEIQHYQDRINETPVREQQLADLSRDYDQSRANYDSLLAKRNQSELATNLEKRQQGEQFRIIDPPSLPTKPYQPNRLLFSIFGLLGGAFVAAAGTALGEIVDDRIRDEKELQEFVSAQVLAEIPSVPTPMETLRGKRLMRLQWLGAVAMVVLVTAEFLVTYYHG
ncbi:MAG: Wzz/FepE/Etk N-terminal domain-containing protein [Candidatus Sulfotelmatobacter sp.]